VPVVLSVVEPEMQEQLFDMESHGIGTVVHSGFGSGTGFGPGSNVKCSRKSIMGVKLSGNSAASSIKKGRIW